MDNLFIYLLKVSVGIIMFYLSYMLFFRRDTFYLRNRIFLLGILLLSFLIPVLKIYDIPGSESTLATTNAMTEIIKSGTFIESSMSEKLTSFDYRYLLISVYLLISFLFLSRLLISIIRTLSIVRKGTSIDTNFPKVVISEFNHTPFSFFPYIVIPRSIYEDGEYSGILAHENAHIRQGHTFDLLLIELLISFLWFNPFIWLIKKSIKLNHEYLADSFSIKGSSIKEYQYKLLNLQTGLMIVPFAHNFSSQIKNRIIMINKRPTHNYAALKSIIILPLVAVLLVMFSFKPGYNQLKTENQKLLLAQTSETEILKFLAMNTGYPQEARNSSDTGKVFIVVKMKKGGMKNECKAFAEKKEINVPFLDEIVIVGNKPLPEQGTAKTEKVSGIEHQALITECLRVAYKLVDVQIPEWKDKDMEFAIAYKFILK